MLLECKCMLFCGFMYMNTNVQFSKKNHNVKRKTGGREVAEAVRPDGSNRGLSHWRPGFDFPLKLIKLENSWRSNVMTIFNELEESLKKLLSRLQGHVSRKHKHCLFKYLNKRLFCLVLLHLFQGCFEG